MKLKAVIFDLDGVIVDSEPIHERAFLDIFNQLGFAENHAIDFADYYGRSDKALWIDFLAKHQTPYTLDELSRLKQERFLAILQQERPLFPEIRPLIEKLSRRFRLAIASGSNHAVIDMVIEMGRLRPFLGAIVSVYDVPHGKPAPDVFLRAAELLRVDPADCCVIEDAATGVEAALAAGMQVIAITNSLPAEKLARATWVVGEYAEVERILLEREKADRVTTP